MRSAITIGIKHGTGEAVLVHGPIVNPSAQLDMVRALGKASASHPEFSRVEVWESDGGVQLVRKFEPPNPKGPIPRKPSEPAKSASAPGRFEVKK